LYTPLERYVIAGVYLFVCLSAKLHKKLQTNLAKILRKVRLTQLNQTTLETVRARRAHGNDADNFCCCFAFRVLL